MLKTIINTKYILINLNCFDDNCRFFNKDEIKFWANSPEEVQQLIDANKFGL